MILEEWPHWTEWHLLSEPLLMELKERPATYMIGAHTRISRAVGVDDQGILTIGTTSSLRRRLRQFYKSAKTRDVPDHMAGWRFSTYEMGLHFALEKLQVCWRLFDTSDKAAKEEARLLRAYIQQHMEQPPLNYSASWR